MKKTIEILGALLAEGGLAIIAFAAIAYQYVK